MQNSLEEKKLNMWDSIFEHFIKTRLTHVLARTRSCSLAIMSASTPAASAPTPDGGATPTPTTNTGPNAPATQESALSARGKAVDKVVVDYLRTRGHTDASERLQRALDSEDGSGDGGSVADESVSIAELVKELAELLKPPAVPRQEEGMKEDVVTTSVQNLLASIGSVGAEDILSTDPLDRQAGYRELESWVDGSLDMYRVCVCVPLLTAL